MTPKRRSPRQSTRNKPRQVSDLVALLRLGMVLFGIGVAVVAFPPLRSFAGKVGNTFVVAMEVSRANDANRVAVARAAIRYGISYDLSAEIRRAALDEGIDPDLAYRLVAVESEFKVRAISPVGALGLTQLMPATAAELEPGITREEIFEPSTNLRLGFRYLRWLLREYDGDVTEALHAYNRGPGTVARLRAQGRDPANGYADKVMGIEHETRYTGSGLLPMGTRRLPEID